MKGDVAVTGEHPHAEVCLELAFLVKGTAPGATLALGAVGMVVVVEVDVETADAGEVAQEVESTARGAGSLLEAVVKTLAVGDVCKRSVLLALKDDLLEVLKQGFDVLSKSLGLGHFALLGLVFDLTRHRSGLLLVDTLKYRSQHILGFFLKGKEGTHRLRTHLHIDVNRLTPRQRTHGHPPMVVPHMVHQHQAFLPRKSHRKRR